MKSLTHKQAELLDYIKETLAVSNGVAPSFDEMKDAIQLKSKSGVARLMSALEERGYIRRIPNRARCIEVCEDVGLAIYSTQTLVAELSRRRELNRKAA